MKLETIAKGTTKRKGIYTFVVDLYGGRRRISYDINVGRYKLTAEGKKYFANIIDSKVEVDDDTREIRLNIDTTEEMEEASMFAFLFSGNGSIKQREKLIKDNGGK